MKENSIEEDIVLLKEMQQNCLTKKEYKDSKANKKAKAIEHILSDYKRVLKENEKLKKFHIQDNKHLDFIMKNSIPVQKVKAKIEELNDVSNAEELEDTMDGKNYTITELVQYVLQELLESEE